jgi:KaiC/GvpD/RAD55 family RecA-like ATPase
MKQISTGIQGLDELLGGGLPKGKCILVVGSPGSGKTTLLMQFLHKGALTGERGLYITMDEKPEQIKENFLSFGWKLDKLEKEGKIVFLDATPIRVAKSVYRTEDKVLISTDFLRFPELTLEGLIRTIRKIIDEENIQRIAIDPITTLILRYGQISKRRKALLYFFDSLIESGCTSLITTEIRTGELERSFQLEEFLSQGVILLHTIIHSGNVIRAIQIEKMRGIQHDTQLRPYQITNKGIEVYSKDKIF